MEVNAQIVHRRHDKDNLSLALTTEVLCSTAAVITEAQSLLMIIIMIIMIIGFSSIR